jgi:hypothetical protein
LTGRFNPFGIVFDFFSDGTGDSNDVSYWTTANLIVVNRRPAFSPAVRDSVLSELRVAFPHGEQVGDFEVRWR